MPIADCGNVVTCLSCIDAAAVQQAVALYYGDQTPADPKTERVLNRCQQAIGRETQRFLAATSKAVALCWDGRNRGQHHDSCPDAAAAAGTPGRRAADAITRAAARRDDWICRSCGGDDGLCDGLGDFSPTMIGSAATCPSVTVPGGASCGRPIVTLRDLADCTECLTRFHAACMDRAAIPAFASYPADCN
jgi:hypothetical protein